MSDVVGPHGTCSMRSLRIFLAGALCALLGQVIVFLVTALVADLRDWGAFELTIGSVRFFEMRAEGTAFALGLFGPGMVVVAAVAGLVCAAVTQWAGSKDRRLGS